MRYVQISDLGYLVGGRLRSIIRRGRAIAERGVGQRHVAFALRAGQVVAVGTNSYSKTHPRQSAFARLVNQPRREYLHAELSALIRSPRDADTLVVLRYNASGIPVCAKPCPVCDLAISTFNPNLKVIHS